MLTTKLLPGLALLLASSLANATSPRDPATAELLFDKGRTAAAKGDWATACPAFEQSQALDPATGTLLNLGECHYRLGHLATAWQDYVEALRELPPADARREYTLGRVAELERRVPRVTIRLGAGAPEDTRVVRSGVTIPSAGLGVPVPVDPGEILIVASSPGRAPARFTVAAKEAQTADVEVAPGPTLPPGAATEAGGSPWRTVGWVSTTAGIGAVTVGAVTGVVALTRASAYRSACGSSTACANTQELNAAKADAADARGFAAGSTGAFIAGAALTGVGLYLLLTQPAASPGDTPRSSSSLSVTPFYGGAGAAWRVSF